MTASERIREARSARKTDVRAAFAAGRTFDVTNHYITREDHPCYGTRRLTVDSQNTNSVTLGGSRIEWPKRVSQFTIDSHGVIRFYGGGAAQAADELFLTFAPVDVPQAQA